MRVAIDDQVRVCRRLAADRSWTCSPVYADRAVSGGTDRCPGHPALLAAVDGGACGVVVAESLDRLSRDQEHVAALLERCRFAGVGLFTHAGGEVGELHVGLKGTMNALYLVDLADKTRRGLRRRVAAGASAGGLCYGCRVVPAKEGEDRGGRTVDAAEAEVVRRIFRDDAAGLSPKAIAAALNREGVSGPHGRAWSPSTVDDDRERGTGMLGDALNAGVPVLNRLGYRKDPTTGPGLRSRVNTILRLRLDGPQGRGASEPPMDLPAPDLGSPSRLRALLDHLDVIEDTREPHRVASPLQEVLFLAVCGTIVDCDDYDAIAW